MTPVDSSYYLNEPRRALYHILLMGKVVQLEDMIIITIATLDKHLKALSHILKWCLVGALHSKLGIKLLCKAKKGFVSCATDVPIRTPFQLFEGNSALGCCIK